MGFIQTTIGMSDYPQTYIASLEAELTSVGWVFVSEKTSGTYLYRIWKSPAAINREAKDFYVVLRRLSSPGTSATYVWFICGTNYIDGSPGSLEVGWGTGGHLVSTPYIPSGIHRRRVSLDGIYEWANSPITANSLAWSTITPNYIATFTTENGEVCYSGLYIAYEYYRAHPIVTGKQIGRAHV